MLTAQIEKNLFYDGRYYDLQQETGVYSGIIDLFKFAPEVRGVDRLLDFGCGGGYILEQLDAKEKIGVEVNEAAARDVARKGIKVFPTLDAVEDGWADVIISHHALEHVDRPLDVAMTMLAKLRPGGKVVIVTPTEGAGMKYQDDDVNFHLYTWSPSNLGNLLKRAGFAGISAEPVYHRWPPYWYRLKRVLPLSVMHALCVTRGRLGTRYCQVKAVGYKPLSRAAA